MYLTCPPYLLQQLPAYLLQQKTFSLQLLAIQSPYTGTITPVTVPAFATSVSLPCQSPVIRVDG
ncbi:hypothetical protein FC093_23220 [Ilyomonas limi]|uniref:Uncharacterized protein n=1 Tax=Ilyomonas limi TaxID=2575867 RepID=A0A4U3KPW7_9BACT|nr:hypothetical protein [Ilyomonas limi]TKK64141.1 hypothetical protein FC093_23220 [Ilyomonas limi]